MSVHTLFYKYFETGLEPPIKSLEAAEGAKTLPQPLSQWTDVFCQCHIWVGPRDTPFGLGEKGRRDRQVLTMRPRRGEGRESLRQAASAPLRARELGGTPEPFFSTREMSDMDSTKRPSEQEHALGNER